ncbi:hypothetical protein D3C71_1710290 [compost metagenome]
MHVRSGGAAGGADLTDDTAAGQLLADLHVDFRHVAEHADKALTVVDEYRVAVEEVVADQDHLAACRGLDRGAGGYREV